MVTRDDLNNVFGSNNIDLWADINNDEDSTAIAARITYALTLAEEEVKAKLRSLTYDVTEALALSLVKHAIVQRAADLLYSPRAISDEDPSKDLMSFHRKQYETFFKQVQAGQLDLGIARSCRSYPKVPDDEVQPSFPTGY